jgi:heat shock protein HtpX
MKPRYATPASFRHRVRNAVHTALLLAAMAALAGFLGYAIFGSAAVVWWALAGAAIVALVHEVSPAFVLRLTGAQAIQRAQAPRLHALAESLAARAGLARVPRLYYLPTRVMNAFAAGSRANAAIAVSDGLLRNLDARELAGVVAHEFAHLRANDLRVMTLADVVARMTALLSLVGQMMLLVLVPVALVTSVEIPWLAILALLFAPALSVALQLALSRTREYDADVSAAELTGDPRGLAMALDKLERLQGGWMERMFMARAPKWLRTHPQTQERIRRLLELERDLPGARAAPAFEMDDLFAPVARAPRWHWHGLWY